MLFDRAIHSVVNGFHEAIPQSVKRAIKRVSPGIVDTFYRQLTRLTSDRPIEVQVQSGPLHGRRLMCSLRHQRSCYLGNFEPYKAELLAQYLAPGQVFFDVGGHIGYFSLIAAGCVRPTGLVVAFEPSPQNVEQFKQNMQLNSDLLPFLALEETAVADTVGTSVFENGNNSYVGHLVPSAAQTGPGGSGGVTRVNTTTLDDYSERTGRWPNFVKIDAEGAESRILEGMTRILAKTRPILLVEIHDAASREFLTNFAKQHSYSSQRVADDNRVRFEDYCSGEAEYLVLPDARS